MATQLLLVHNPTTNPSTHFLKFSLNFSKIYNFTKRYKPNDKLVALKPKNNKLRNLSYPDKIKSIIKNMKNSFFRLFTIPLFFISGCSGLSGKVITLEG